MAPPLQPVQLHKRAAGSSDVQQPGTGSQPSSTLKEREKKNPARNISPSFPPGGTKRRRRLWPADGLPVMLSERLEEKQAEKLGGRHRHSN